jgi:ubiquinone/menaquinone biosynthesis C-methylase UbiE
MLRDRPISRLLARGMYRMHGPRRLRKEMRLLESGIIKPGDHVLDIGCGPGHLSLKMARLAGDNGLVHALDIHPLAMERIRRVIEETQSTNIRGILTDCFQTGLAEGSIDIAFIFNTIDMVRDKRRLARELERVLKPGALIVIRNKRSFRVFHRTYEDIFDMTLIRFVKRENTSLFFQKIKEGSNA